MWETHPRQSEAPGCMTWHSQSRVEPSTLASCRGHRSKHRPWKHRHTPSGQKVQRSASWRKITETSGWFLKDKLVYWANLKTGWTYKSTISIIRHILWLTKSCTKKTDREKPFIAVSGNKTGENVFWRFLVKGSAQAYYIKKRQPPETSRSLHTLLFLCKTVPRMQLDCKPLNLRWTEEANTASSQAILGVGYRGLRGLCTSFWHHTRDLFSTCHLWLLQAQTHVTWLEEIYHISQQSQKGFGPSRGNFSPPKTSKRLPEINGLLFCKKSQKLNYKTEVLFFFNHKCAYCKWH